MPPKRKSPEQGPRLLRTKLNIPRPHPDLVERSWLIERLNEGSNRRLILVSAPAGSGKTTLLSTWAARCPAPIAWISLDEHDNDPARFWAYFVAGLQTIRPEIGSQFFIMLQSPQPLPTESFLTELLNAVLPLPGDFFLVLDDFHTIQAPVIHTGLAFLLENLPAQMHLFIAGRTDPPLPLAQLRVRRELLEVKSNELRFSSADIAAFFRQIMSLDLSAEETAAIEHTTEGWVAGVQIAALSMQGVQDIPAFIRSFTGKQRYIFEYLAQEVLNRQPEYVQRFLLSTSILDRLCASLCDDLMKAEGGRMEVETKQDQSFSLQPSTVILDILDRSNLFIVPLDNERQWYRYHHLFTDFLRTRLEQTSPAAEIAELHRKAGRWFGQERFIADAIHHATEAGDFEYAFQLIRMFGAETFDNNDVNSLLDWLAALPPEILRRDLPLSMLYAWALLATNHFDQAEIRLQEIEQELGVSLDSSQADLSLPANLRGALSEIAAIRANLAFQRMDIPSVLALSARSIEYLGEDVKTSLFQVRENLQGVNEFNLALANEFSGDFQAASEHFEKSILYSQEMGNYHLIWFSSAHLAQLQVLRGRLRQAEQTCRQALRSIGSASASGPSPNSGLVYSSLGNILYEWNDLENAEIILQKAIDMGRLWANWETLAPAYICLSRLRMAQGDLAGASAAMDELEAFARRIHPRWGVILMEAQRARLNISQGNPETARRWIDRLGWQPSGEIPFTREAEALAVVHVLLGLEDGDQALDWLSRLLPSMETGLRQGRLIEALALQSAALLILGQEQAARNALERARSLAAPEGYLRTFLDCGLQIEDRRLETKKRTKKYPEPQPVSQDNQKQTISLQQSAIKNPLTSRELEVLRLMADGLTNQQIADELFVSLNTVKTHVKRIIACLEVQNRTQAIARARQSGLLE